MGIQSSAKRRSPLRLHSPGWGFVPPTHTLPGAALTHMSPHTQGTLLNSHTQKPNPIPSSNSLLWKVLLANKLGCCSEGAVPKDRQLASQKLSKLTAKAWTRKTLPSGGFPTHLCLEASQLGPRVPEQDYIEDTGNVSGSEHNRTCASTPLLDQPHLTARAPEPSARLADHRASAGADTLMPGGTVFTHPQCPLSWVPGCFSDAEHREQSQGTRSRQRAGFSQGKMMPEKARSFNSWEGKDGH